MLHVEQIKWFGTKNTTSEYYSGIIKEEDWWFELCNLCCHHRMGWLLLSCWNRGRQIPIFKASRKVDVLVATKMNISSIGVHSLMRVWNGWEKANMNTCHFAANKKPITPQTMTGTVERAIKITAWTPWLFRFITLQAVILNFITMSRFWKNQTRQKEKVISVCQKQF